MTRSRTTDYSLRTTAVSWLQIILAGFILLGVSLFFGSPARAETFCFCSDNVSNITTENYNDEEALREIGHNGCKGMAAMPPEQCSESIQISGPKAPYDKCEPVSNQTICRERIDKWDIDYAAQLQLAKEGKAGTATGTSRFIPECAFQDDLPQGSICRDIGIFVVIGINLARYLISIVGALALLMFIFGGIILIVSAGNAERVTQGKDIIVAAIIGIIVSFSAFLLIRFLSDALNITNSLV